MQQVTTDIKQLDLNGLYSYADYLTWQFKERLELIKGKIFPMAAPSTLHQTISWNLALKIGNHFQHQNCRAFSAPFDVRLTSKNTVVQPDLCVVCDLSKLDERGCAGAPELIVEILSPSNIQIEMKDKFDLYEQAGVQEYWVVYPPEKWVLVYSLKEGKYQHHKPYIESDTLVSIFFPNLKIALDEVFPSS